MEDKPPDRKETEGALEPSLILGEQSKAIGDLANRVDALTKQVAGNQATENAQERRHTEQLNIQRRFFCWQRANFIVSVVLACSTLIILYRQTTIMDKQRAITGQALLLNANAELANVEPEDVECSKCPPLSAALTYRIKFRNLGKTQAVKVVITSSSKMGLPNLVLSAPTLAVPSIFLKGVSKTIHPTLPSFPNGNGWGPLLTHSTGLALQRSSISWLTSPTLISWVNCITRQLPTSWTIPPTRFSDVVPVNSYDKLLYLTSKLRRLFFCVVTAPAVRAR
jgi:hypothetical protein